MNWQLELTPLHWSTPHLLRPVALALGQALIIGRNRDCDICVPSPYAARHHARVWRDQEAVWLQDLESLGGTLYQGHHQPEFSQVRGPTRLEVDDLFRVGEFAFMLTARFPVPEHWRAWSEGIIPSLARTIQTNRDWS